MSGAASPSSISCLMAPYDPAQTTATRASSRCGLRGRLPRMPIKRIEIRWRDLDGFGHVNNSTYLTYLEEARDQHLTDVLGEAVHRTVIRHIEVDFFSGLTQEDDYVDVDVSLTGVGSSSVTLGERILSTMDGRVAATARAGIGHT